MRLGFKGCEVEDMVRSSDESLGDAIVDSCKHMADLKLP
jgi:hypothetical protein